jgi:hypothetical protein
MIDHSRAKSVLSRFTGPRTQNRIVDELTPPAGVGVRLDSPDGLLFAGTGPGIFSQETGPGFATAPSSIYKTFQGVWLDCREHHCNGRAETHIIV